ncbi:MAG: hypothetical protein HC890_04940 [Chloroflexaceae bacterium]|nr:hypothetical protein [Chloroflexaceae bacterium]
MLAANASLLEGLCDRPGRNVWLPLKRAGINQIITMLLWRKTLGLSRCLSFSPPNISDVDERTASGF